MASTPKVRGRQGEGGRDDCQTFREDLQSKMAAEAPESRFNLALGWKYYADHLDATNRRGEGLLALSEAAKQVALIPAKLRDYPESSAILAAHHSRRELG